ncbi:MAG TPA: GNAT family N-acetyltransferase [Nocardioides sp.]|nr:GNAT family N-acetyltransferase [Nocardioides sp.]
MTTEPNVPVHVAPAGPEHAEILGRLWLLFRHDLTEFTGGLPFADATYRSERLALALRDATWAAALVQLGEVPVGFALVRSIDREPFVLNSFFVVRGARRSGVGREAVRQVLATRPGRWTVAFQDTNPGAVGFWRRVAADHDPQWTEEARPVPDRPDLPPDSWISFRVARADG